LVNSLSLLLVPLKLDSVAAAAAAPRDAAVPGARGTVSVAEKVRPDGREPRQSIRVTPVACCVALGSSRATPWVPL
jgi:hypothetical protein